MPDTDEDSIAVVDQPEIRHKRRSYVVQEEDGTTLRAVLLIPKSPFRKLAMKPDPVPLIGITSLRELAAAF